MASFNFSFDISSECHACKTFHSACKTSDSFGIVVLSANTCYVVAHSGGGVFDGQNPANVINGQRLMVKYSNIRKTSTQPQRRPGWLQLVVQWSTIS